MTTHNNPLNWEIAATVGTITSVAIGGFAFAAPDRGEPIPDGVILQDQTASVPQLSPGGRRHHRGSDRLGSDSRAPATVAVDPPSCRRRRRSRRSWPARTRAGGRPGRDRLADVTRLAAARTRRDRLADVTGLAAARTRRDRLADVAGLAAARTRRDRSPSARLAGACTCRDRPSMSPVSPVKRQSPASPAWS